jgi:uncharacterized protein (TIGR00255 family)
MIKSMTGFGRGECSIDNRSITIEMKSVNHRYCDINIRMPRKLIFLENHLKGLIKNELTRGKIDVFINYEDHSDKSNSIVYNELLARQYMVHFEHMAETFHIQNDIQVSGLSRYPEVLKLEEQDEDEETLQKMVITALHEAISAISEARHTEGQLLKADLKEKLDEMLAYVKQLKALTPEVIEDYRQKLHTRIGELMDQTLVDKDRLALEVAVFADKSCVDEEIVRLESHITHMKDTLDSTDSIGRKLDFISQEMNREANTVLSKANNLSVSNQGIELKTLIEKVREQIQNIE